MFKKKNFILLTLLSIPLILNAGIFDTLKNKIKEKALKKMEMPIEETNTEPVKNLQQTNNNVKKEEKINKTTVSEKLEKSVVKVLKFNSKTKPKIINDKNNFNTSEIKKVFNTPKSDIEIATVETTAKEEIEKITHKLETENLSKKEERYLSRRILQRKLILYKIQLDKAVISLDYKKMLAILSKIVNNKQISKKLKMKFLDYAFWQVIDNYTNVKNLTPEKRTKVLEVLQKIINLMDTEYNVYTKIDKNVFNILNGKIGASDDLKSLINIYFPYGINNPDLYLKFFKLFGSELNKKDNSYIFVLFLKKDFLSYFNLQNTLDENLINYYLRMLLYNGLFNGNEIYNVVKKLKYLNPLNSDVYYYLSIYNKHEPQKYIKLLETSIKYNVYNIKSWKNLISFLISYRSTALNDKNNKEDIIKYDNKILKLINYVLTNLELDDFDFNYFLSKKAKIYYLEGTGLPDYEKLLKSAEIYYTLKNYELVRQILKYLNALDPKRTANLNLEAMFPKAF